MGRHRSDSDDDRKSKRKKKKKARSGSDSDSSRHKKSKRKHRRSRSRSRDRYSRRSRSRSRSVSTERYRSHRGRSRSKDRYSRRSRSPSPRRRRSGSRSHDRRSRSRSRGRIQRSAERTRDSSQASTVSNIPIKGLSLAEQIPGFHSLTPAEQAEERMKLALRAAAAADEDIKKRTGSYMKSADPAQSFGDSQKFASSVAEIEADSFAPAAFTSSRSKKEKNEGTTESRPNHDEAIFGSLASSGFTIQIKPDDTKPLVLDPDSFIHPNLYTDPEERMDRWLERLAKIRRRKLEGEAMA